MAEVLANLDHREKGGYTRALEPVRSSVGAPPFAEALLYVAATDNT